MFVEVIGQMYLLGEGKLLWFVFELGKLYLMILWGLFGVGKMMFVWFIVFVFDCEFIVLFVVFGGVKDICELMEQVKDMLNCIGCYMILFVDEIYWFNKGQQDVLLLFVELGFVIFIGVMIENLSFEVNLVLLLCVQVYVLKLLNDDEMCQLFKCVQEIVFDGFVFDDKVIDMLVGYVDGDVCCFLNLFEQVQMVVMLVGVVMIDVDFVSSVMMLNVWCFDKGGDNFYDQILVLYKLVCGLSLDGVLYWFCWMIDGGVDLKYFVWCIVWMVWEDIGLVDLCVLQVVNDVVEIYEWFGLLEGEFVFGQVVIYFVCVVKSNVGYNVFNQVMVFVKQDKLCEVFVYLCNVLIKLMKEFGYGYVYCYVYDELNVYVVGEMYLLDGMCELCWYQLVLCGFELKIVEKFVWLCEFDCEVGKKD